MNKLLGAARMRGLLSPRCNNRPTAGLGERGQDAVEFALLIPLLLLIIVFILDLGRVTYFTAVLHNAARQGARYGSIEPADTAGIEAEVAALAVGIAAEDLVIDITDDSEAMTIEVIVSYDLPILTPLVATFLGGSDTLTIGSSATLGYEQ